MIAFRILIAVLLLVAHCAWAYSIQGRVAGVSDGDTITVLDAQRPQHKIRLAGIDASEKKRPHVPLALCVRPTRLRIPAI
jgi:endonuclease YncB( thermonuclease family)